jgi:RND family efflux transporter MFP subunit
MRNHFIIGMLLTGLILAAGCGSSEDSKAVETKPRPVRIEKIVGRNLPVLVLSVGRLVPDREVVVSAQVPGIVMQLNADVGAKVEDRDALVKLDPTDYRLALNETSANLLSAQARLSAAENSYERARRLLPENAISRELFDAAEAEYRSSRAQVSQLATAVDMARRRLEKTVIAAPFDGYVTRRFVELGQNVAVGDPAMGIADMQAMRVRIHINENDYVHLDKDDPVTVAVEAYPDTPFPGRVDKIGIQADARTNTFEVEILLENPQFVLKAGLTARVSIQTEVIPDTIMIPQASVLFREDRKEVFVIEQGGKAAVREVKLGRIEGSAVRILEGLASGDNLVVAGAQYLKPGDTVTVTPGAY